MPLSPIYDIIFALLIILPLSSIFFSSAFLYNKLCEKKLLSLNEETELRPLEKIRSYLITLGFGLATACIFYYLIINDSFDFTLIGLIPPLFVALLCKIKNGFTPPVSVFFMALCVLIRIIFYSVFSGFTYGLSIILSFLLVFVVVTVPKFIFRKTDNQPIEIMSILIFSLMGSYFSPLYALIYVTATYLILTLGYEIPNYIAKKRKGSPIFTFRTPFIIVGTTVSAIMLFI